MTTNTDKLEQNTHSGRLNSIIDDALRSLQISGSLLLRESYASPWSIAIPDAKRLCELLDIKPGLNVVTFHLLEFGQCEIQPECGESIHLRAGEMVICFGGQSHQLRQGGASKIQGIEELLGGGPNIQRPDPHSHSHGASLLCGAFLLKNTRFNPLYEGLPALMHTRLSRSGESHKLSGVVGLMTDEMDRESVVGGYIIERLLEVLCAEAIRAHIESAPVQDANWLRGIKDPVIGHAIAAIHSRPEDNWSVQRLAGEVAMSPSRFAARFAETIGISPMAYTTQWRMNLACRALADTHQSIEQIARDAGYASPAAFSRSFKKHLRISPAAWRNQQRASN